MFSKLTKTIYKSMLGSFISAAKRPPSTIPAVVTIADFSRCLVEKKEEENEKKWKSFSDADFGGRSRATLTTRTKKKRNKLNENNFDDVGGGGSVVFEGNLDSSVPQLRDEKMREIRSLKRSGSGFAGFGWNDVKARLKKTSRERKDDESEEKEQEEEEDVDLEYFSHVRFTMKNYDGRAYVCSIKTERDAFGNGEHDLWQAFLLAPKTTSEEENSGGRNWTELTVPLDQFMKTYKGGVVESQTIGGKDSLRRRGNMRSIGIACGGLEFGKGDMDGAFRLEVKKIELLDEERAGAL